MSRRTTIRSTRTALHALLCAVEIDLPWYGPSMITHEVCNYNISNLQLHHLSVGSLIGVFPVIATTEFVVSG